MDASDGRTMDWRWLHNKWRWQPEWIMNSWWVEQLFKFFQTKERMRVCQQVLQNVAPCKNIADIQWDLSIGRWKNSHLVQTMIRPFERTLNLHTFLITIGNCLLITFQLLETSGSTSLKALDKVVFNPSWKF